MIMIVGFKVPFFNVLNVADMEMLLRKRTSRTYWLGISNQWTPEVLPVLIFKWSSMCLYTVDEISWNTFAGVCEVFFR